MTFSCSTLLASARPAMSAQDTPGLASNMSLCASSPRPDRQDGYTMLWGGGLGEGVGWGAVAVEKGEERGFTQYLIFTSAAISFSMSCMLKAGAAVRGGRGSGT